MRFAAAFACAFLAREGAGQAPLATAAVSPHAHPGPRAVPAARCLSEALALSHRDGGGAAGLPAPEAVLATSGGGSVPPPKRPRGEPSGCAGGDPALTPVVQLCAPRRAPARGRGPAGMRAALGSRCV